ncbi:MAG: hypothetical protein ABFD98_03245 [Syntrophobacteraceae bacterium]|nr:hypothetical protein [Desulfobacteraceae bacterium]
MQEDIVASLTRQVKEEVLENYVAERRLLEAQIEDLEDRAKRTRSVSVQAGRRLNRLSFLMLRPERRQTLKTLLNVPSPSFWEYGIDEPFSKKVPVLHVRGLTAGSRFRKLVLEACSRALLHMESYRSAYEDLQAECRAVNRNISQFRKNFDLLTILQFLRGLDPVEIERRNILGENFSSQEIASLDRRLFIPDVQFDRFDVPPPVPLPERRTVEASLARLAKEIFEAHADAVRRLML